MKTSAPVCAFEWACLLLDEHNIIPILLYE